MRRYASSLRFPNGRHTYYVVPGAPWRPLSPCGRRDLLQQLGIVRLQACEAHASSVDASGPSHFPEALACDIANPSDCNDPNHRPVASPAVLVVMALVIIVIALVTVLTLMR
jgi:hypothetical protein